MGFQDILGHERQLATLSSAIRRDKVHHAYLFIGPPGVGRRTIGMTFARALNCARQDGDACEVCPSCLKIVAGSHPDIQILGQDRTELQIKIDEVREKILRFISFKVYEGRFRVILVLGAERLNNSTANALLKTLEEPPRQTVFILTTANINSLLPTIRSRCQKVRFSPIPDADLSRHLELHQQVDPDQALLLSRLSEGSLGRALSLTKEHLASRETFLNAVTRIGSGPAFDPVALAEQLAGDKTVLFSQLDTFESFLRDAAIQHGSSSPVLRNADFAATISDFSARVSFFSLNRLLTLVWEIRGAARLHINPQVALERLFLELAQVQRWSHGTANLRVQ